MSESQDATADQRCEALSLIATEWFKTVRRLSKLIRDLTPEALERERAQLTFSRTRVTAALATNQLRMLDYQGLPFSSEIPPEPVNPEDFDTDEGLVVAETLEPTVLRDGRVIARGRVILAQGS